VSSTDEFLVMQLRSLILLSWYCTGSYDCDYCNVVYRRYYSLDRPILFLDATYVGLSACPSVCRSVPKIVRFISSIGLDPKCANSGPGVPAAPHIADFLVNFHSRQLKAHFAAKRAV